MNGKKVIIYDDENIEYFIGEMGCFGCKQDSVEITGITDLHRQFIPGILFCEFAVNEASRHDAIKLDETLMKRIAKYNKEKECEQLDMEIAEKQKKIEKLDDILTDRVGRVDKLKEFIKNIYELNLYDYDYDADEDDDEDYDD